MQKILVVFFSQSGQLRSILERVVAPLEGTTSITWERIRPERPYPFRWTLQTFFDTFPESVKGIPCELQPAGFEPSVEYDLVILGYQPWYLSPSIPFSSFLKSEAGRRVLRGARVITVIGCRNMWLTAQEKTKRLLREAGARLCGNIVLQDPSGNLTSAITTVYWMLTGRRDRFLGIFPKPGVRHAEVQAAERFGRVIREKLDTGDLDRLQPALLEEQAVSVVPYLAVLEQRASRIFEIWSSFILKQGGPGHGARRRRLWFFRAYLALALLIGSPLTYVISSVVNVLRGDALSKELAYYAGVELRD